MRPQIKPALRRVWRDPETVQIGLDPERALVLTGLDPALRLIVEDLTGGQTQDAQTQDALLDAALARGANGQDTHRLFRLLSEGGALIDAESAAGALDGLGPAERERLAPDLAARSLVTRGLDGGAADLRRRRATSVSVFGAGRVGASVATLLASAGVGRVNVFDPCITRPTDLAPAGLSGRDIGRARAAGAARAAAAAGPSTEVGTVGDARTAERPDIAVLAPDDEPDRALADALVRAGVPHLVVRIREARAILGPFVLPGESSCVRCHDLHRAARDPLWPRVLDEVLATPCVAPACDVVLATDIAAHAVLHLLAFLDGTRPASVDATVEMTLPAGRLRRRSWSAHPSCGCHWDPEPAPFVAA